MTIATGSGIDRRYSQVVNHPTFVPAALVIDHEQTRDVGKDIDERANVVRVGRQAGLGLEHDPYRSDRRETAVWSGCREHSLVVHARDQAGERVRLKSQGVQQVILEKLARLGLARGCIRVSFGIGLRRQLAVRSTRLPNQPVLEWSGQIDDVAAIFHRSNIGIGLQIWVAWPWWLLRVSCARRQGSDQ